MLFVLDVGNTNTVLGVFEGDVLLHHWRIETSRNKTEDEYGITIEGLLLHKNIKVSDITGIIISSVVPPIMSSLERMCKKYFNLKPMIVGPGVKTGLNIKTDNPKEVGADRIVNAVAGINYYGTPLIIVDFGTATTYCYINKNKEYLGGAIAPGIGISTEALISRASKLPRIELTTPVDVVGSNTITAMQSGIIFGYVGQVEGIVNRIKKNHPDDYIKVIATGGLAKIISKETNCIDSVDSFLTLKGLALIYKKNQTI
ncbi:MAG: coaX [Bacillales bacterium]|jgi:type III pantothenate kinase|nr:coaX [Bacillales bacterium]